MSTKPIILVEHMTTSSGVRDGSVVIVKDQIQRMSVGLHIPYDEVMEYVVEHEQTHAEKSDGYVIKTFHLATPDKKSLATVTRYFDFWLTDENRVMKIAKRFPCSDVMDASNLRSIKQAKKRALQMLSTHTAVCLTVRGCLREKDLSLRDIGRLRKRRS